MESQLTELMWTAPTSDNRKNEQNLKNVIHFKFCKLVGLQLKINAGEQKRHRENDCNY